MKSPLLILFTIVFPFFASAQNNEYWESHAEGMLPKDYVVFNVATLDENNVWAICWRQPFDRFLPIDHEIKILKTKNGGIDWEIISMEQFPGYFSLDFQLIDENTAWMSVQDLALTDATKIIKTEDGGQTWEEKYEGEAAGVWVRFFNENEGFAASFPHIATTSDGGVTWQTDSLENIQRDEDFNMSNNSCVVVNDVVWAGTPSGKVGRSLDKGRTWEFFDVGMGSAAQVTAVAFKDEMNGMALGSSIITRFATTSDGGQTWNLLGPSGFTNGYNLEYVPGTQGTFMACSAWGNPPVSAYTNDFGQSWTIATKGTGYGGVSFESSEIGWAGSAYVEDETSSVLFKWVGSGLTNTQNKDIFKTEVFPNPTTNVLNLQIEEGQVPDFIKIYNSIGKEVYSVSAAFAQSQIQIGFLPKGSYFLKFGKADKIFLSSFVKN